MLTRGIAIIASFWIGLPALASGGRALPAGEEYPAFIEKIYSTPVGEVEFTDAGPAGHAGFLRGASGALLAFVEVRGPTLCEEWLDSSKWTALPEGCEFVFFGEAEGRFLSVRSEEMEEASLFQAARGKLRGVAARGRVRVSL